MPYGWRPRRPFRARAEERVEHREIHPFPLEGEGELGGEVVCGSIALRENEPAVHFGWTLMAADHRQSRRLWQRRPEPFDQGAIPSQ